jgi:Transglycosylase SLT domain
MLPQWPGTDVTTMDSLITFNNMADHPAVTGELIMAICWEETFFNNVKQDGGSALGFGQMEPAELKKIRPDLSATDILSDPGTSIAAMSEMLDSLFNRVGRDGGLRGYAGYWFRSDADWRKKRQAIIDGWTACEQALQQIDAYETDPDATIEALKKSKKFDPDKVAYGSTTWRDLLFPTS